MLKNSLMSPEIEHQMHHSEKFLIDLDNMESETSDESDQDQSLSNSDNGNELATPNKGNINVIEPSSITRSVTQ